MFELIERDYRRTGRKTLDDVLARWKLHLKGHFADIRASELSTVQINAYILRRQRDGASGASVNRELAIISRMMRLGERTTPPLVRGVPHFDKVKESDPRTGFLDQHAYDKLRLHARDLWLRGLLCVHYTFGFRRAELLQLRVRQVIAYVLNAEASLFKDCRNIIVLGSNRAHRRLPTPNLTF